MRQIVMAHHHLIGAAMVNQNHQIVIETVNMIEEAQVAAAVAEAIVTVIRLLETAIMTEETLHLHMILLVQVTTTTAALVMVIHHLATVVLPLKEMVTVLRGAAALVMVAVVIHLVVIHLVVTHLVATHLVVTLLVAKPKMEASAILQVTLRQETKALLIAITN